MPEIWTASVHLPGGGARAGRAAEADGFDGISFGDTQHVAADPFAGLCLAAAATTRLGLMVGVTNPVTRHPAVTAAAAATVQAESGGRAVLGVGRGDSSLAHLGRHPATVEATTRFVEDVQEYLATIGWIERQHRVPVDVAATGPRMLAMGGRLADRVTVNVGAQPEQVARAIAAVRAAGPTTPVGAYLVVAAHPDPALARDLARGPLAAYAHFSGMPGGVAGSLRAEDREVVEAVAADYDLSGHGRREARHVAHLDDGFVDRFGVVGTPAHCADRLRELAGLGLDRVLVVEGRDTAQPDATRRAHRCLVDEVLPAVRERD